MAEKPIDPRIDEALKKCNPQKAIYALAEVENEVIDQLGIVETDMDNLETSVNNKITVIEGVANEANTKATNAVTTANQANATANTALTNSETTQTNLTALQGVVNTAYDTVGTTESTSTVNIDLTTIGGQKESAALPVASAGKAGVINTSDYIKFEGYDARIKSLEGQSITYLVQFPNNNPTQAEITATYRAQYHNAPFPPLDSTVLMDTTNELSYRWFENSQTWSKISAEPIGLFTLQKEGLIKGSDKVGEVYPNADGTGAVNGWDQLTTRVTNAENGITANTTLANNKGGQLSSNATATGANVNLLKTDGTQISTTALPVASETQAGIMSAAMVGLLNSLSEGSTISAITGTNEIQVNDENGDSLLNIGSITTGQPYISFSSVNMTLAYTFIGLSPFPNNTNNSDANRVNTGVRTESSGRITIPGNSISGNSRILLFMAYNQNYIIFGNLTGGYFNSSNRMDTSSWAIKIKLK